VHLLPPRRVVSSEHYDAVPLQMWRFNAEDHPNILRPLSMWQSPDLTILTEERSSGFPLSRIIAERGHLDLAEVLMILRQVKAGLDQASECGIQRLDIHPCNIFLKLVDAPGARAAEALLQNPLDSWPMFTLMLRPHMTMRSLYAPFLIEAERRLIEDTFFDAEDFRSRSFIALAACLLSGERQVSGHQRLPHALPDELAAYVSECTARSRHLGRLPSPQDFLDELEDHTAVPGYALGPRLIVRPRRDSHREVAPTMPLRNRGWAADLESNDVGAVSARSPSPGFGASLLSSAPAMTRATAPRATRGRFGVLLWAAAFLLLGLIAYALFAYKDETGGDAASPPEKVEPVPPASQIHDTPPQTVPEIKPPAGNEEIRRAVMPAEAKEGEPGRQGTKK
jgi:hypothetical protein